MNRRRVRRGLRRVRRGGLWCKCRGRWLVRLGRVRCLRRGSVSLLGLLRVSLSLGRVSLVLVALGRDLRSRSRVRGGLWRGILAR